MSIQDLRPNTAEKKFLSLAYNRFYDLFDEIISDSFWTNEETVRFMKVKECFMIYSELLNYEPIQWVLNHIDKHRPPMEGKIGRDFFSFLRNIFVHFPLFSNWDDIWFDKSLINWSKEGKSIDKFLTKYQNHGLVKYRLWDFNKKEFTYVTINFPQGYLENMKIRLSDLLSERDGAIFSLVFMRKIIDTQVEK